MRERGQGKMTFFSIFPCSPGHEQDWQPYPVDPYFAESADLIYIHPCMYGHTSINSKSMDRPGEVANPARGQLNSENEYFPVRVRAHTY